MDNRKMEPDGFKIMYQAEIKQYLEREQALEENMNRAYALIVGTYCSKAIQGRLRNTRIMKPRSGMILLSY